MTEENNVNAQASQQQNADPTETGGPAAAGKTFTQDEVNRIVSERLARERAKTEPSATDTRVQELDKRENNLKCHELVEESEGKYPKQLLDVLDTSNSEAFKAQAEKLVQAFPAISHKVETKPVGNGFHCSTGKADNIAAAFGLTH